MKIGLISDIHGNLEALEKVLEYLSTKEKVDNIIVLGDIVGYMANPNECVQLVKKYDCIQGNHDFAITDIEFLNYFNPIAKKALLWTIDELTIENKNILKNLPLTKLYENEDFTISHGTLISPEEFLYLDNIYDAYENFQVMKTKLLFVGHTHVPKYYVLDKSNSPATIEMTSHINYDYKIQLEENKSYIFNIGSVGQPRDYNNKSCFVIYDTVEKSIKYIRLPYDIEKTAQKIKNNNLPSFLYKRIFLGI